MSQAPWIVLVILFVFALAAVVARRLDEANRAADPGSAKRYPNPVLSVLFLAVVIPITLWAATQGEWRFALSGAFVAWIVIAELRRSRPESRSEDGTV